MSEYFRTPTEQEHAAQIERTRADNLRKYGDADRINEKSEAASRALDAGRDFPAHSPERKAATDSFLQHSREAHRLDNIEHVKARVQRREVRQQKRDWSKSAADHHREQADRPRPERTRDRDLDRER